MRNRGVIRSAILGAAISLAASLLYLLFVVFIRPALANFGFEDLLIYLALAGSLPAALHGSMTVETGRIRNAILAGVLSVILSIMAMLFLGVLGAMILHIYCRIVGCRLWPFI